MEDEVKEEKPIQSTGLSEKFIQIISFSFLIYFAIVDKTFGKVIPPLNDVWYLILFGVGVFGTEIKDLIVVFIKNRRKNE